MRLFVLASAVLLLSWQCNSEISYGDVNSLMAGGSGRGAKEIVPARKEDIKHIKCDVCKQMAVESIKLTDQLRQAVTHITKLSEADIIDKLELLCDYNKDEGDWINRIDLVENGQRLDVVDTGKVAKCNTECATVARACTDMLEDVDLTDWSTLLYKQKPLKTLQDWLCKETTEACNKKPPALPKGRKPGPVHEPMSESDVSTRDMMRKLSASGMNGQMFNTESLKAQMAGGWGDEDDDDAAKEEL